MLPLMRSPPRRATRASRESTRGAVPAFHREGHQCRSPPHTASSHRSSDDRRSPSYLCRGRQAPGRAVAMACYPHVAEQGERREGGPPPPAPTGLSPTAVVGAGEKRLEEGARVFARAPMGSAPVVSNYQISHVLCMPRHARHIA
jgi:hypothetical protein